MCTIVTVWQDVQYSKLNEDEYLRPSETDEYVQTRYKEGTELFKTPWKETAKHETIV